MDSILRIFAAVIVTLVLFGFIRIASAELTSCPSGDPVMCFQCSGGVESAWSCCPDLSSPTGLVCEPECNNPEEIVCPEPDCSTCEASLVVATERFEAAEGALETVSGELEAETSRANAAEAEAVQARADKLEALAKLDAWRRAFMRLAFKCWRFGGGE